MENSDKAGVDWYVDDFKVHWYERNNDWVSAANLRIEEYRHKPVDIILKNVPEGSSISVEQVHSEFGWGGRYSAWAEGTILDDIFPYYFNQGFCVNEFKWQVVEKEEGVRDFTIGDRIADRFENWGVPLSGNTIFWEVEQTKGSDSPKAAPTWFQDKWAASQRNGEDMEQYRQQILDHTNEVVSRYAGRNINYKVFNEPVHGMQYRYNLPGIWDDVINTVRAADPQTELMINDYQLVSADAAMCFVDLMKDRPDIDYIGIQAHMEEGFMGDITQGIHVF